MIRPLAAALCILAAATPAIAVPDDNVVLMRVHYADLNLASPDGAARMAHRIRYAARNACDTRDRALVLRRSDRQCRQELEIAARRQLALAGLPTPAVRIASAR